MTKSELIERLAVGEKDLSAADVELAIKAILETMSQTLEDGGRIEIRGFGSFALRYRKSRIGRNPKSGEAVEIAERYVPHFKPGKKLKQKVNEGK